MKLKPQKIDAQYVYSDEEYTIINGMNTPILVYGTSRSKKSKGIAFGNIEVMRQVAKDLLAFADMYEKAKKLKDGENV